MPRIHQNAKRKKNFWRGPPSWDCCPGGSCSSLLCVPLRPQNSIQIYTDVATSVVDSITLFWHIKLGSRQSFGLKRSLKLMFEQRIVSW